MDANNVFTINRSVRSSKAVVMSMFQLAQLLRAGVGIDDALDDVRDMETTGAMRRVWSEISIGVKSGKPLSELLQRWPTLFDSTVIALIRAGEKNGELYIACMSVHDYLQWHARLKSRFATLLIYPLFSMLLLLSVVGFLFVSVVPAIKNYLVSGGAALSWHTVMLINLSEWLQSSVHILLLAIVLVILSGIGCMRYSHNFRILVHSLIVKLPVLGRLIVDLSLSRYTNCSARLYSSGISLEDALELSESTVPNLKLKKQLSQVRYEMIRGSSLGSAFKKVRDVPAFFMRMVAVGESTGTLEDALLQLSVQQQQSSETSIERIEQLVAPFILLIIGSCLLWIVVSMISPVYSTAINAALNCESTGNERKKTARNRLSCYAG